MSKIIKKYLQLKEQNKDKLYLFKSGSFYIFVGEDATKVSNYLALAETKFSKEFNKCGFPVNSLDKYVKAFQLHEWDVEIINDTNPYEVLRNTNIDTIKLEDARNLLRSLKADYEAK